MSYEKHPWGEFLDARHRVMFWMKDEQKYSNKEIAECLSMNENQVNSILIEMSKIKE